MPGIKKTDRYRREEAEVVRRLALALETRGLSKLELARRLDTLIGWEGGSSINQWFLRRVLPSGLVTASLWRALEVNPEWLYFGQGAMEPERLDQPQQMWARGMSYAVAKVDAVAADLKREAAAVEFSASSGAASALAAAQLAFPPPRAAAHRHRQRS